MNSTDSTTPDEQNQRFDIVSLIFPLFGRDIDGMLKAAKMIQEYLLGRDHPSPSSTDGTA